MYLNFEVDIPKIPGKINYVKKGGTVYVRYVLERVYHPDEYSCAVTPQVRQTGNRLSGLAGTAYASLLT